MIAHYMRKYSAREKLVELVRVIRRGGRGKGEGVMKALIRPEPGLNEILGHKFDKRLESFAPCYSQSLLLVILFSGFKNPYKKICEARKLESIHE
jgi:hypothetical protein